MSLGAPSSPGNSGGGGSNVTIVGPLGQAISAASLPVVIASDQSPVPVSLATISTSTAVGSESSNTQIVAAVAGKAIKGMFASFRTFYSGGAILPILTDGNGGTTIWEDAEQAISGSVSGSVNASGGNYTLFETSVGNPLYFNPNGQTVYYIVIWFAE